MKVVRVVGGGGGVGGVGGGGGVRAGGRGLALAAQGKQWCCKTARVGERGEGGVGGGGGGGDGGSVAVWVVGVVCEEVDEDEDSDMELTAEERAEVARIEEECSALAKQAAGWQPAVATMIMTRPNRAAVTAKQDAG